VAGAWSDALERLDESGVVVRESMTGTDIAAAPDVTAARPPLTELAALANRSRFAPGGVSPATAAAAWVSADAVRGALQAGRTPLTRARVALHRSAPGVAVAGGLGSSLRLRVLRRGGAVPRAASPADR